MTLKKAPFERTRLEEDDTGETFTVRINKKEREWLDGIKKDFDIKSDSRALKMVAKIGTNVLHSTFSDGMLRYLFKKDRTRLSDFDSF